MAYTKREFLGPSFSARDLSRRWDQLVLESEHFRKANPTVTDLHYRRVVRNLLQRWVPRPKGLRVLKLDLYNEATGTSHAGHFVEGGARVVGVEISFEIARQACRRCGSDVLAAQGDVRELPFGDDQFDFIFSLGTLEHVQQGDQPQAVQELLRVLKPGGMCLCGVNNRYSLWLTPLLFELLEWTGLSRRQWSYEPTYPPSHLRRLFREAGFIQIRSDGTLLFPKWLRAVDLWSAQWHSGFLRPVNRLKDLCFRGIAWGVEQLESWGILSAFADQTLTIGSKPCGTVSTSR